jgi:hypothetical protein
MGLLFDSLGKDTVLRLSVPSLLRETKYKREFLYLSKSFLLQHAIFRFLVFIGLLVWDLCLKRIVCVKGGEK